jgi:hypothetical protein
MTRLRDRATGDILVLIITLTISIGVLGSGMTVALISIIHPETNVTLWVSRVSGILNTMVGLIAGFLAGRTKAINGNGTPPSSEEP